VDLVLADENYSSPTTDNPTSAGNLTLWSLGDNQNTVRDVVNDSGTLEQHIAYSPFGQQVSVASSYTNGSLPAAADAVFGYTGTYTDPVTTLQLHGLRWYNPGSERWLTEDPLGLGPDINPYRYCGNNPVIYVDPSGYITVRGFEKARGDGSRLPTARYANAIRGDYQFQNWFASDWGYMIQRVNDEGTFSFSADGAGGRVTWKESYDEGWVRGMLVRQTYFFTDQHNASPHLPALAIQKAFGEDFKLGPNNTLYIGRHKVCCWDFTMTAKFDMRNAWRDDWVALVPGDNPAAFGGQGNHTWEVGTSVVVVGGAGGVVSLNNNENNSPLYGFAAMLYHERGPAPPVGQWKYWENSYHGVCNDSWTESWKTGQPKPTMKYTPGGYK